MSKRRNKPFSMPRIPSPDGIGSDRIHYRVNPSGHIEQVVKKKTGEDETLNELSDNIDEILEDIEMSSTPALSAEMPFPGRQFPQMVGSRNDNIRNLGDTITNATGSTPLAGDLDETDGGMVSSNYHDESEDKHNPVELIGKDGESKPKSLIQSESFTGTAGIAIGPVYGVIEPSKGYKRSKKLKTVKPNGTWESTMRSDIDRLLNEWEPEFQAGEYDPGEHYMDHHGGEGVAGRKAKAAKAHGSSETKNHGEPFGAKHNKTAAMCDVEESGVETEPQGSHESSVGDPLGDDCCDEVGHNWPDQPRHTGGGVAEPVKGNRYSDGGVLHGATNEWSPARIGKLMGEDRDLQTLFDNYANKTKFVHLEGFQALCDAHGIDAILDQTSLLGLMANNASYMFHEHRDADGTYWLKAVVTENDDPMAPVGDDEELGDDYMGDEGEAAFSGEDDLAGDDLAGDDLADYGDEGDLAGDEFGAESDVDGGMSDHEVTIDGVKYVPETEMGAEGGCY